jgi:M6 family metalloprotease-like protein
MSNAKKNPILWIVLVAVTLVATTAMAASARAEELAPLPERAATPAMSAEDGYEPHNINSNAPSLDCNAAVGSAGSASALDRQVAGSTALSPEGRPPSFMPPHPALLERARRGEVTLPEFVTDPAIRQQLGIEQPQGLAAGPQGSWKALALLVKFTDNASQVGASYFDTLLFGSGSGTLNDYYNAVSYGTLDIVTVNLPSAIGWCTMPQTYAYYVDGNYGFGSYPSNAQKLAEDAVLIADDMVDFTQYDNNSDGWVDTVFIIHAGPGAEFTGSANDIWSHSWATVNDPLVDGVRVNSYTAEPEYWISPPDMTVGVFAHELGHVFGLPDLYDTDGSSAGAGRWSLMAGGAWNGALGNSPALPDPWSRAALDFVTPLNVVTNLTGVSFPSAATSQTVYRLWTNGAAGSEYFLVENRQQSGYDAGLPAAGLLIWHVDESKGGNQAECDQLNNWNCGSSHQKVALEQADGLWNLEHDTNGGDSGDPYPGTTNNRQFATSTTPNSSAYAHSSDTCVGVSGISNSGATMTADLSVSCGPSDVGPLVYDSITVDDDNTGNSSGNADGLVDCGESIELDVDLANQGADVANSVSATISTADQYVTWLFNTISDYGNIAGGGTGVNNDVFDFSVDAATPPGHVIDFDLDISAANGGPWSDSFSVVVSCADAYEVDDSWDAANEIADGASQAHNLYPAGDEDWLTFTLEVESAVSIETSGAAGDTRLWLYDGALSELEFNDNGGAGLWSRIDRVCGQDALPAGVYYVKIDEFEDDDVIPAYDISFDVVETCPIPPATLWIEPKSAELTVGDSVTVSVMISEATDLYAVALELEFDPAKLEIVDGDAVANGIQISPGDCPVPDVAVQNSANNISGTITYSVFSVAPSPPCNGGTIARATFHALAAGASPLHFNSWLLTNAVSQTIPAGAEDGALNIAPGSGSLEGAVLLQGRSNNAGAEVCAWDGDSLVACTTSSAGGDYTLTATEGTYNLTVEMERYLDGERASVVVTTAATTTLPSLSLKGGDTNDDDVIDNFDLSFMSALYGLSCGQAGWDDKADINADCSVNIQDFAIAGGNYQESSPVNWPLLAPIRAPASTDASIWLQGPSEPVLAGDEITVTVHISGAADLYASQLALSFAAGDLQVVDSDPDTEGVQINSGACPYPDFLVGNAADNAGGTIDYALTQLSPRAPVNGGCTVAAIRLQALQAGLTTIQLGSVILSDLDGRSLPFGSTDLTIVVHSEFLTFLPLLSTSVKGGG